MTHTITIETRIPEKALTSSLDKALSRMSASFQQAKHAMFSQKMHNNVLIKSQFCAQYGLSSRQFNSVKQDVEAIHTSQTTNLKRYIQEDFGRFNKVVKHLNRYQKQLKSHAANQTILSPNTLTQVVVKKRGCEQKKQRIVSRIARREALLAAEKVSICFGTKDLFGQQYYLQENNYKTHADWLTDFRDARCDEYFSKGAKDETNGNQSVSITRNAEGDFSLSVRMLNGLTGELGKHLILNNLDFPYKKECLEAALAANEERKAQWKKSNRENLNRRHKANIATLKFEQNEQIDRMQARNAAPKDIVEVIAKQQKKLKRFENPSQNNLLCDFGQALSYRFKKDDKGWRIIISVPALAADEILSDKINGALGVDLNDHHLSVTYINEKGNKVWSKDLYFRDDEFITSKQTETRLAECVKWITEQAKTLSVPIYIEALDFKRAKATSTKDKRFNKVVSSMITAKFKALMTLRCFEKGIELDEVDPAYTSFLGRLKYGQEFNFNTHQAAAMMIARRGLGLKDNRIPAVCVVKIKQAKLRFSTPVDVLKKDVAGQLKATKRAFDLWCKQQYKAIYEARQVPPVEVLSDIPI